MKAQYKVIFFLFLISLKDKFAQNNGNNVFCYVVYICICLCISKMDDRNDTKDRREELGIFCYYKVLVLPMKQYNVIKIDMD